MKTLDKKTIEYYTTRHDILTTSMLWMIDPEREKYYAELEKEDLSQNMEMFFKELRVLRDMLCSVNDDLRDSSNNLER